MAELIVPSIGIYLVIMFLLAYFAQSQIHSEEDYLVAGRRLSFPLTTLTLLATWFGAGTLLTSADEVFRSGLSATALEPYGAGACLLLVGFFYAKPLWEMKLFTLSDFYRRRYGRRAEQLSVLLTVPGFIGWIAVQMIAVGGVLHEFLGISLPAAVAAITIVATAYTLMGGMWSVTLTDAVQMALIVIGLVVLALAIFDQSGILSLPSELKLTLQLVPVDRLSWLPKGGGWGFLSWVNLWIVGALGNIAGQDLAQRIFSARSATVAKRSCFFAGILYMMFGTIPILLALAAVVALPGDTHSVLPSLAERYLSPALALVFILTLISAVLSTIDSAILATSSLLARNLLNNFLPTHLTHLRKHRLSVVLVALTSSVIALSSEDAYTLLENSYASTAVGLLAPLTFGLFTKRGNEYSALSAMLAGALCWGSIEAFSDRLPAELISLPFSFTVFFAHSHFGVKRIAHKAVR